MHDLSLLINLSVSLVAALALGLLTQRLGLSPIAGYLLAGIALGPQTPGFVADPKMSAQFAEIGVILLMFGVGLHFHLRELLAVRNIALPGAVAQIAAASALGLAASAAFGHGFGFGLTMGLALAVASTVVLTRVLADNNLLQTSHGHIAVGWLIVEDIFTVLVLVILPGAAGFLGGAAARGESVFSSLGLTALKVGALGLLVLVVGARVVPWILRQVAYTRSRELFTLTVLALALAIATGSAAVFGVSMALGAFIAGLVVGQSEVSHQAAADALPMRDAFAVLFFVSVGMLFDPKVVWEHPLYLLSLLAIIMIAKPLSALIIVWALGFSVRTGLVVALGLAQIGEFSFILAGLARDLRILPAEGQGLLVACALVSISLNPIVFRAVDPVERWLQGRPRLWRLLNRKARARGRALNREMKELLLHPDTGDGARPRAIVVGYGPTGQAASHILEEFGIQPVIVDLNLDTIRALGAEGKPAVYGDATQREILRRAGIEKSKYLLVTTPDRSSRAAIIMTARDLNPDLKILARSRYIQERAWLERVGATTVCSEEAEVAAAMARLLLEEVGASEERIREEVRKARRAPWQG